MTPERIAELKNYNGLRLSDFRDGELADLLDTTDREAKLREAVWSVRDRLYNAGYYGFSAELMAALESKGGE